MKTFRQTYHHHQSWGGMESWVQWFSASPVYLIQSHASLPHSISHGFWSGRSMKAMHVRMRIIFNRLAKSQPFIDYSKLLKQKALFIKSVEESVSIPDDHNRQDAFLLQAFIDTSWSDIMILIQVSDVFKFKHQLTILRVPRCYIDSNKLWLSRNLSSKSQDSVQIIKLGSRLELGHPRRPKPA